MGVVLMNLRSAILAVTLACALPAAVPAAARAQSGAAEHVAAGDRDRAANPAGALKHYEAALATDPGSYDALWRASVAAVDLGEGAAAAEQRAAYYRQGEQ